MYPSAHTRFASMGLVLSFGVLMLAVPRLIASCYALYPETAYHQNDDKLSSYVFETSISDLTQALLWYQSSDFWEEQGFFYLKLFNTQSFQDLKNKRILLQNAQTAIKRGLALSPIDPFGWFQLASVNEHLKTPKPQIINALRLSIYAERVEPELVMNRLAFSYNYYTDFNPDMQKQWQNQLLTAWNFTPHELIKYVAQHPELIDIALQAFVYSPDEKTNFLKDLEITIKKPL